MNAPYHSRHTGLTVDHAVDLALAAGESQDALAYEGTLDLNTEVSGGEVTGLSLLFLPVRAFLQVEIPADGLVIFPVLVRGSLTPGGFSFYLSGMTDSVNYRLHYRLTGDPTANSSG